MTFKRSKGLFCTRRKINIKVHKTWHLYTICMSMHGDSPTETYIMVTVTEILTSNDLFLSRLVQTKTWLFLKNLSLHARVLQATFSFPPRCLIWFPQCLCSHISGSPGRTCPWWWWGWSDWCCWTALPGRSLGPGPSPPAGCSRGCWDVGGGASVFHWQPG